MYDFLPPKKFKNICSFLKFYRDKKWNIGFIWVHYPLPSRHEMSVKDLNQISTERDMSETSQKHLKRDVFFVTSLRRLKNISKKMSFVWRL